jgi:hypothetical protein
MRDIISIFDENFSVGVGTKGRYINYMTVCPSEGASSLFWAEFDSDGEPTGLQGEIIDSCIIPLSGPYRRRRIREDYDKMVRFHSQNRGRYEFQIRLPDGSVA